eukprot:7002993-Pyramimonas_sp.AAC.1
MKKRVSDQSVTTVVITTVVRYDRTSLVVATATLRARSSSMPMARSSSSMPTLALFNTSTPLSAEAQRDLWNTDRSRIRGAGLKPGGFVQPLA